MSDYLEKHCPELVKQIEEASEVGAEEAQRPFREAMEEAFGGMRQLFISREFALSIINDQRNRMLSMRTALDKQEEVLTKQELWIHRLYWLSGIGWGLAVGFALLWRLA